MQKLYFINNSEKERILNLHETRTQEQYLLTEQKVDRLKFNDSIREVCKKVTPKYNPSTMDGWVDYFLGTIGPSKIFTPYTNEDINNISAALKGLGNIESFCGLSNSYFKKKGSKGGDLLKALATKIQNNSAWVKAVQEPLTTIQKNENVLGGVLKRHTESLNLIKDLESKNWKKENMCLTKYNNTKLTYNDKLKRYRLEYEDANKVKSVFYDSGAYYQIVNGVEYPQQEKVYYSYSCKGNVPVPTKNLVNINNQPIYNSYVQQPIQGFGTVTNNVKSKIPELLKTAGIEGNEINQNTIDALYNKLIKKQK